MKSINKAVIIAALLLIFAVIGFSDSLYLTVKHFNGEPVSCSLLNGCEQVTTSKYATVAGTPIALLGVIYYLCIIIGSFLYFDTKNKKFLKEASYLTFIGFAASLVFLYLQFFVIKALCEFCLLSAFTSTALFVTGLFYLLKFKNPIHNT